MDQSSVKSLSPGGADTLSLGTPSFTATDDTQAFILSSIGISEPHKSRGIIMVGANETGPAPDFARTLARLIQAARQKKADGLIHVGFSDHHSRLGKVAHIGGESAGPMAVLAWGTMIQLLPKAPD